MKIFILSISIFFVSIICNGQNAVGIFNTHQDIGKPTIAGDVIYNNNDQSYLIKGAGYNLWFGRDELHYAYNKIKGDFILTANFKFINKGADPHRKIGWMIRASETDDAAHMTATVHGDGLTTLQWRRMRGAFKEYIMRVAHVGEPLQEVGRTDAIDMPNDVLAGIFICSHNPNVIEEAQVWNVRIEQTVPDTHNGYKDGILGSRLETLNIQDSKRKVIYEDKGRIEAPNWMPDGNAILFNKGGNIYTVPIEGGEPKLLPTIGANRNNNDHVISYDKKSLGISSHRDGMPGGGSSVYILPITGGTAKLITDSTPSYLHGWTIDNKEVVYTAQRVSKSTSFNIYKKPINGGPEVQLTFLQKGLADGPECSPDGKYIYYNSTQSGNMQLWRMKMDGTEQTQLTFDEYNNWFAHVSPDNKWIAFISFPNTIDPGDHPFYKRVMLRLMPINGGGPKVIATLFGGQGTINTPSWSPDSKYISFISNSGPIQ